MKRVDDGRHRRKCRVCNHEERAAIEADYRAGKKLCVIAPDYDISIDSLKRHAKADKALRDARSDNVLGALQVIIDDCLEELGNKVELTGPLLSSALNLSAKIRGQLVDRTLDITSWLETASATEMEHWKRTGRIPEPGELQEQQGPSEPQ